MSATTKHTTTHIREVEKPDLLTEIIDRMGAVEARLSRPSPVKLLTFEDIERFADKAARSGMIPPSYNNKPDAIVIAVMMGSELGLAPMQSVQNIAVINSRPAIWGDALPGLCRASGLMRTMREWSEGEGDNMIFYCEAARKDDAQMVLGSFSVADAIRAGLWGKDIWKKYPKRMLQMRARSFCLRDAFPDVLKGLVTAEEAEDTPIDPNDFIPSRRASEVVSQTKQVAPPEERYPTLFGAIEPKDWLANFGVVIKAVKTKAEVDEIRTLEPVHLALEKATPAIIAAIKRALDEADVRVTEIPPAEFLATLRTELDGPLTAEEIDAILARADVQKAQDAFRGANKAELDNITTDAVKRAQGLEMPPTEDGQ